MKEASQNISILKPFREQNVIDKRRDGLSPLEASLFARVIKQRFMTHFALNGYTGEENKSIVAPDGDPFFVVDTMTFHKELIAQKRVPEPGIYAAQDCLRTQNFRNYVDFVSKQDGLKYMSLFQMIGVTAHPEAPIFEDGWGFLVNQLGLPEDDISIKVSDRDQDLIDGFRKAGVPDGVLQIGPDIQNPRYYQWSYGVNSSMRDLRGRGVTFAVRYEDSDFKDIGNLIAIKDSNGHIQAWDYGFGVETLIAATYGLKNPFRASVIGGAVDIFREKNGFSRSVGWDVVSDSIASALAMIKAGVEPNSNKSTAGKTCSQTIRIGTEIALNDLGSDNSGQIYRLGPGGLVEIANQYLDIRYAADINTTNEPAIRIYSNYLQRGIVRDPATRRLKLAKHT